MASEDRAADFSAYADMMDNGFIPTGGCRIVLGVDAEGHHAQIAQLDGTPAEDELIGVMFKTSVLLVLAEHGKITPPAGPATWA